MRLCFAIGRLFRSGGLQRDCIEIARRVRALGHDVTIVCTANEASDFTAGVPVDVVDPRSWTNPGRDRGLGEAISALRGKRFDRVVGFNKMPGLDIYYAGDPPYVTTHGRGLKALMPRYFAQSNLERACFDPAVSTRIICLTERQVQSYRAVWNTPADRFRVIPPSLSAERRRPELRTNGVRDTIRAGLGVAGGAPVFLAVAAHGHTKGLDRTIAALRRSGDAILIVAGIGDATREGRSIRRWARQSGIDAQLRLLGHVEDIPALMAAADAMVHPARTETAGMVLLEAIANGLPVIASGVCGFADHVRRAGAGIVLDNAFSGDALAAALVDARDPDLRARWSAAGAAYGRDDALTLGHATSAALVAADAW